MLSHPFLRMPSKPLSLLQEIFRLKDDQELNSFLLKWIKDVDVCAALEISNPLLLKNFETAPTIKAQYALLSYLIRMAYRPTPSGLFSTIAKLQPALNSTFSTQEKAPIVKSQSLARFFTSHLDNHDLEKDMQHLSYSTNPSLRVVGNEVWVWNGLRGDESYSYQQQKFSLPKDTLELLSFCRDTRSFDEIISHFQVPKTQFNDFKSYLLELVECEIIQHDRVEAVIGGSPFPRSETDSSSHFSRSLPRNTIFKAIAKRSLQNDEISQSLLNQLHEALDGIQKMSPYWNGDNFSGYIRLKEIFRANYSGRAIPLLDFLHFHSFEKGHLQQFRVKDEVRDYISNLINHALAEGSDTIELSDADIAFFSSKADGTPTSGAQIRDYSLVLSLAAKDSPLKAKLITSSWGLGGLRGRARFMHVFPETEFKLPESEDDKIYFDIEFDSRDYVYDLSQRPQATPYILKLSHSRSDGEKTWIPLSDVDVTLQGNFFKLFSRSHGKEIVPAITTPFVQILHDHPFFRFLGFVAQDGQKTQLRLPYSPENAPFTPAFVYKKVLISPRRWSLPKQKFLQQLRTSELNECALFPQWLTLRHHDRVLPIDTKNPYLAEVLTRKFKDHEILTLEEEWFFDHGQKVLIANEAYTQEIMVSWQNPVLAETTIPYPKKFPWKKVSDNPISIHLDMPLALMEKLLVEKIHPTLLKFEKKKDISGFYFLRYEQPQEQLRLRLFLPSSTNFDFWKYFLQFVGPLRDEFLIMNVSLLPMESESTLYGGARGEKLYYEISKILSRHYFPIALQGEIKERLPFVITYLALLTSRLYSMSEIDLVPASGALTSQEKKLYSAFWKDYKSLTDKGNEARLRIEAHLDFLCEKLRLHLKKVPSERRAHFIRRILHLEFYRVLGPRYNSTERIIPHLAVRIARHDSHN